MRKLTEQNATDAVLNQLENTADPRLKEIMTSLISHMHAFVREVELTNDEWLKGIQFLTEVGHKCDALRQEFILLSDTLGVSGLVDAINHRQPEGATESSILGPFYRDGAPMLSPPAKIYSGEVGDTLFFSGRVTAPDGAPLARAMVDVWQTSPVGLYDNQDENQPDFNFRGRMLTDEQGGYEFQTEIPVSYKIPDDGPVGQMLHDLGRHPWRPAHVHFKVSADGYDPLTTMIFFEGDPYLDSDAVLAVKDSLVVAAEKHDSSDEAAKRNVEAPFYTARYDFGLKPAG